MQGCRPPLGQVRPESSCKHGLATRGMPGCHAMRQRGHRIMRHAHVVSAHAAHLLRLQRLGGGMPHGVQRPWHSAGAAARQVRAAAAGRSPAREARAIDAGGAASGRDSEPAPGGLPAADQRRGRLRLRGACVGRRMHRRVCASGGGVLAMHPGHRAASRPMLQAPRVPQRIGHAANAANSRSKPPAGPGGANDAQPPPDRRARLPSMPCATDLRILAAPSR